MSKAQVLDKPLMDVLTDPEAGTPEDKLRLFIIYYIINPHIPENDLKKYETALTEAGCDVLPLSYIKRWK